MTNKEFVQLYKGMKARVLSRDTIDPELHGLIGKVSGEMTSWGGIRVRFNDILPSIRVFDVDDLQVIDNTPLPLPG